MLYKHYCLLLVDCRIISNIESVLRLDSHLSSGPILLWLYFIIKFNPQFSPKLYSIGCFWTVNDEQNSFWWQHMNDRIIKSSSFWKPQIKVLITTILISSNLTLSHHYIQNQPPNKPSIDFIFFNWTFVFQVKFILSLTNVSQVKLNINFLIRGGKK